MKLSFPGQTCALALLAMPLSVIAQDREPETNKTDSNRPLAEGERGNDTALKVGINQAITDLLHNPEGLFKRLDTDNNSTLSLDEFKRMSSVGSQGTASNTGTVGVTGAAGATGTTGQTTVTGIAGDPATAPATPSATGSSGSPNTPGETTAPTNPTKPATPANPNNPSSPDTPKLPASPTNPANQLPEGAPVPKN
ncbi:hypothetical protein EI77_02293 [Prosthecobacter fusiformis]|uniref:EF-hand domain-containing protein n=1 Tax=Prosthecobacter fusiformis TaxID=48464 RepID=A0A4R7RZ80_9BACT|nr:hypothetical protein [Prosthecobacter fusiformis]TDU71171.1 hypothetical protein EI77_02293 [Prosthecobacter fusiformis]